jgi:nucleoside 2-deoxyribosyltransferase
MKVKIYLTGPVAGRSVDQLNEFAIVSEKLEGAGFEVETPLTAVAGADHGSMEREELLRERVLKMLDCDQVISLDDYEKDLNSTAEVKIARLMDMKITPVNKFLHEYVKNAQSAEANAAGTGN